MAVLVRKYHGAVAGTLGVLLRSYEYVFKVKPGGDRTAWSWSILD